MAAMLTMSMLSLAGIPPLAGFLGKYYIFSEAIKNGYVCAYGVGRHRLHRWRVLLFQSHPGDVHSKTGSCSD